MKPNGHWHSEHERLTLEALEGLQGQSPPPQIAPKIADRVHGDAPASPDGLLSALKRLPWWAIFYGGLVLGLALNHRACSPQDHTTRWEIARVYAYYLNFALNE